MLITQCRITDSRIIHIQPLARVSNKCNAMTQAKLFTAKLPARMLAHKTNCAIIYKNRSLTEHILCLGHYIPQQHRGIETMISIGDIKSALSRIDVSSFNPDQPGRVESAPLIDNIKKSYRQHTFKEVSSLLEGNNSQEELRSSFIHYLKRNETLVSGSALYYTCTPEEPTTKLLCLIAEWISETSSSEAPVSAMSILMPSLDLELKLTTKYPSLCAEKDNIKDHLTPPEIATLERLQRIPEPKRSPQEKSQLKTLQAKYEQSESYRTHCNIINGWRIPKVSLERVLATHILSEDGLTLIPISLITEENAINPYSSEYAKLTHDEMQRIEKHNTVTEQFLLVKKAHEKLRNDDSHLLGHLTTLCKKLQLNDAHGGMGKAESAAAGAYPAIISFCDYYRDLEEAEKNKIPSKLKVEIETLIDLASDPDKNNKATENLATCIGLRREAIEREVKNHENELSKIARTDAQKESAFIIAKTTEEKFKLLLEEELSTTGTYSGRDSLPYRALLLKSLNIEPSIKSLSDFNYFMEMSADDIKEFGKITSIRDALINTIEDTHHFAAFVNDTPDIKLESYFEIVGSETLSPLNSIEKIKAVFFEIYPSKINLLLKSVNYNPIITSIDDFIKFLEFEFLSSEQRAAVFESIKGLLPNIIKSSLDLGKALSYLSPEKRATILESIKEQLPNIIKSGHDLGKTLSYLSPEQCAAVLDSIKRQMPNMIKSSEDLWLALSYLSSEQCTALFASIKEQLPNIIKSGADLALVLPKVPHEQRAAVFASIKEQLPNIIKSGHDLARALNYLSPEQCAVVCESIKRQLPNMIKSGEDLWFALNNLSPERFAVLFESIKGQLPNIIKSGTDLTLVLPKVPPEQRAALFESIIGQLPSIINSSVDLMLVLPSVPPEQRAAVFASIKEQLPNIIKSSHDLWGALIYLSPEQRAAVIVSIKGQLPNIIKSGADLALVLPNVPPEQRAVIFELIKEQLPNIIKSGEDLAEVLPNVPPEQRAAVFEFIKEQLPNIIKSGHNLGRALSYLSPEQCAVVCESIKGQLSNIIKSDNDLGDTLRYLSPEQCAAVFESIKGQLPNMIKSGKGLWLALNYLSPKQRIAVFDSIKGQLPNIIVSLVHLGQDQDLPYYDRDKVLLLIKETIKILFNDALDKFRDEAEAETHWNDDQSKEAIRNFISDARAKADEIIPYSLILNKRDFNAQIKNNLKPIIQTHFPYRPLKALRMLADILMVVLFPVGLVVMAFNKKRTGHCFFSDGVLTVGQNRGYMAQA